MKKKEQRLNDLYSKNFTLDAALEHFEYLTSKNRSPRTTKAHLIKCYHENRLGSLLRRLDPIAFNCAD